MVLTDGGRLQVLLIMGDPREARLVRECLQEAAPDAVRLECAASLEQARERLGRDGLGVVVLDLDIPGSSGIEAIEHLDLPRIPIPFIVLSERDEAAIREQASDLGARDFVRKNDLDGVRLLEALVYANHFRRTAAANRPERSGDLVVGDTVPSDKRSARVDAVVRSLCDTLARDLHAGTSFRFKLRAGNAEVERPDLLRDLVANLLFGIIGRCRAEGGSSLSFDVKTYRCGSRVTLALHVDGCRPNLGTTLLEPFLQGETNSSAAPRLVAAARRLRDLRGNIRFGNRPGVGPWIEIMVPSKTRPWDLQRSLAQ